MLMVLLGLLLAVTSGCSRQILEARDASNIAAGYLEAQKEEIEDTFKRGISQCVEISPTEAEAIACVDRLQRSMAPLLVAYSALRASRNALELALGAAQAGQEGALLRIPGLVAAMMSSILALEEALDELAR